MNFIARARATEELLALLPTLGITLSADQSLAQAIQARIADIPATLAVAAADHTAALATLTAELEQAGNDLSTAQANLKASRLNADSAHAQASLFSSALAAAGVRLPAASDIALSAADIEAALEARISTRAAEQLASTGTPPVTASPAAAGHSAKSGAGTISLAAFKALAPRERFAFASAGGRCTD
jgi:hypothetical protein